MTGRCGCIKTHSTGGTWTDADLVPPELPEEILEQLEALSDDDLQRLTARTRLRQYKLILLREAGRRRRARLREAELASTPSA